MALPVKSLINGGTPLEAKVEPFRKMEPGKQEEAEALSDETAAAHAQWTAAAQELVTAAAEAQRIVVAQHKQVQSGP